MAGRRLQVPGYAEVSAVCTHPDARRQGLGAALTLAVAEAIRKEGDEPFLHVIAGNENAIALYRKLGFELRREVDAVAVVFDRPPE
jgi:predicted GNAT family acetyltransferase